jgi:glucose/arabinose dehydrogenase
MIPPLRLLAALLVASTCTFAQPKPIIQPFLTGFNKPIKVTHGYDDRLYVAEIGGKIKVVKNGIPIHSPAFLDIGPKLSAPDWALFSITFHPNYQTNGYFYVLYNLIGTHHVQLSRFQRQGDAESNLANTTETPILTIHYSNIQSGHRGGDMAFGKDNFLYISTGDNGPGGRTDPGDPLGNAQNDNLIFGKILRIDVDAASPADNILEKIWAKGVRNPWRFSFDRLTGDFWLGDNGHNDWEEINWLPATNITSLRNFGWNYMEGSLTFNDCQCDIATSFIAPHLAYPGFNNNGNNSASVVGGYVYRGTNYPALQGTYFFGDYSAHKIGAITPNDYAYGAINSLMDDVPYSSIVSFGEGYDGELYVTSYTEGTIGKIGLSADPLPVSLQNLAARAVECAISLEWKSATEDRFSHFEVQRSRNGQTFQTIKTISATERAVATVSLIRNH